MTDIITPDGQPHAIRPQMNITPTDLDDVVCEMCGNFTFVEVVLMKRMPALISPTNKESFVPMQVYSCAACNHVNERFIQGMGGWFKDTPENKSESEIDKIQESELPGLQVITPEETEKNK